jgi:3-oxoacyl-[acyl-carrier protein] reductase
MIQDEDTMKHALVTGSSRGIGRSITEKMLAEPFRVTGTRRSTGFPAEFNDHDHFSGLTVDMGDLNQLDEILKPVIMEQCPDILVNNAGIFTDADFGTDDASWLEVWDRTLMVNLKSAALLSKWFINAHIARGSEGMIINIASRAAYRGIPRSMQPMRHRKGGWRRSPRALRGTLAARELWPTRLHPDLLKRIWRVNRFRYWDGRR